MAASGFSDTQWAAGSMFGLRRFGMTKKGVLQGVAGYSWHDGTNVATCKDSWHRAPQNKPVATKGCTCGFWAYNSPNWRGTADQLTDVTAIVEGFGHVCYGPFGFRASKSRIVAAVAPSPDLDFRGRRAWMNEQLAGKSRASLILATVLAYCYFILTLVVPQPVWSVVHFLKARFRIRHLLILWVVSDFVAQFIPERNASVTFVLAVLVIGVAVSTALDIAHRAVETRWVKNPERVTTYAYLAGVGSKKLVQNYPSVKLYDSLGAALAAYPLTEPDQ